MNVTRNRNNRRLKNLLEKTKSHAVENTFDDFCIVFLQRCLFYTCSCWCKICYELQPGREQLKQTAIKQKAGLCESALVINRIC